MNVTNYTISQIEQRGAKEEACQRGMNEEINQSKHKTQKRIEAPPVQ
jgi:hypothetical protein